MKKLIIIISLLILPLSAFALPTTRSEQNIAPFQNDTYSLGTSILEWLNIFTKYASTSQLTISGLGGSGTRCVQTDNLGFLSRASAACGSGSGGGGGSSPWATTTSQVASQNIVYPLNNTDVVTIGNSASTSAPFYFDPNIPFAYIGSQLLIIGSTTLQNFSGGSYTARASTTLQNFTSQNATSSNATTTTFAVSSLLPDMLVASNKSGGLVSSSTIGNNQLQNSSITINTAAPLGGGAAVSLGGTLNLTCTGCLTGMTFAWPFTKQSTNEQATTTVIATNGGLISGSTTISNLLLTGSSTLQTVGLQYGSSTELQSTSDSYFATAGGGVGIGTITPRAVNVNSKLTVAGTGSVDIIASTTDNTTSSAAILEAYTDGGRLVLGSHASTQVVSRYGLTLGGWGEISQFTNGTPSNGVVIGTQTNVPLVFGTGNAERIRLDANTSTGVGTTTPSNKLAQLQVASSTQAQLALVYGAGNSGIVFNNLGGELFIATSSITNYATSSVAALKLDKNGMITLPAIAAGSGTNCLQINTTGLITNAGSACGSGSSFAYPFTTIAGGQATSSALILTNAGLVSGSTTLTNLLMIGSSTLQNFVAQNATTSGTFRGQASFNQFGAGVNPADTTYCASGKKCLLMMDSDNTLSGVNIQSVNTSNGASAYAFVGVNNDLTDSTGLHYAGMGLNGSNYNDNTFGTGLNLKNDLQLDNSDGPITFNTSTTTQSLAYVHWLTGGAATANERMRLSGTGILGIATTTASDILAQVQIASTTNSQLSLLYGAGTPGWEFRNTGVGLDLASSSPTTYATTTQSALSIANAGSPSLAIGTTTPTAYFDLAVVGTDYADSVHIHGFSSTTLRMTTNGALFLPKLTQSGSNQTYYMCGAATTFEAVWDTTVCLVSAAKFKTNIKDLDIGLAELMKVRAVTFNYKPTGNPAYDNDRNIAHEQIGLIADEVEKIDPRLVTYDKNGDIHGFNYEQYTAWLTKAIQELEVQVQGGVKTATDNWQWVAISLLVLWNLGLTIKLKRHA